MTAHAIGAGAIGAEGLVYSIPHEIGERCAVADLLALHFGMALGEYLLWNETCFPFDDVQAWEQAKALVKDST